MPLSRRLSYWDSQYANLTLRKRNQCRYSIHAIHHQLTARDNSKTVFKANQKAKSKGARAWSTTKWKPASVNGIMLRNVTSRYDYYLWTPTPIFVENFIQEEADCVFQAATWIQPLTADLLSCKFFLIESAHARPATSSSWSTSRLTLLEQMKPGYALATVRGCKMTAQKRRVKERSGSANIRTNGLWSFWSSVCIVGETALQGALGYNLCIASVYW